MIWLSIGEMPKNVQHLPGNITGEFSEVIKKSEVTVSPHLLVTKINNIICDH